MKTMFKKFLLFSLALLVGAFLYQLGVWRTLQNPRPRDARMMCTTRMIGVYTQPDKSKKPFYAIGQRDPVWWNGVQYKNWLWVDFEYGAGWIENDEFTGCPEEYNGQDQNLWGIRRVGG